ncbi:MAG: ATP-binding cassette domain-containing protein [Microthrixaceae bacterium]|nr:ATP-binding cassette domain-containing protein [Microthrixaceae bacterium]
MTAPEVLSLRRVSHRRDGEPILSEVDWTVRADQSWVVMGPNGSGKTTLARIATLWLHPSEGEVTVLGGTLGRTDVRSLRRRVAFVSAAMADMVRPQLTAAEVVVCARFAALEPWWHTYDEHDWDRARGLLAGQGLAGQQDRSFGSLSSGERQRVLLARALMAEPELVVLDEPSAGLDLAGREQLLDRLDSLASDAASPPVVLVTHHVEEIPPAFTHLLAIRGGRVLAEGTLSQTLSDTLLSETFDLPVEVRSWDSATGRRYSARRA